MTKHEFFSMLKLGLFINPNTKYISQYSQLVDDCQTIFLNYILTYLFVLKLFGIIWSLIMVFHLNFVMPKIWIFFQNISKLRALSHTCTKKKRIQIFPIFLVNKWQNLLEKKHYIVNLIGLIESTYSIVHKAKVIFSLFKWKHE
jgi:hypothetical protein